jgi:hypothetical protein
MSFRSGSGIAMGYFASDSDTRGNTGFFLHCKEVNKSFVLIQRMRRPSMVDMLTYEENVISMKDIIRSSPAQLSGYRHVGIFRQRLPISPSGAGKHGVALPRESGFPREYRISLDIQLNLLWHENCTVNVIGPEHASRIDAVQARCSNDDQIEEGSMKELLAMLTAAAIAVGFPKPGPTEGSHEVNALLTRAVTELQANGPDEAFAAFSDSKGKFIDGDLYIFVYDLTGKCVAHGGNPTMVGKDLIGLKDADNKFYVRERVEIAKSEGKGWQAYSWINPTTKQIECRTALFERVGDVVVGCGTGM